MSLKITEGSKVEAEERRIEQNIRTDKNEELLGEQEGSEIAERRWKQHERKGIGMNEK